MGFVGIGTRIKDRMEKARLIKLKWINPELGFQDLPSLNKNRITELMIDSRQTEISAFV